MQPEVRVRRMRRPRTRRERATEDRILRPVGARDRRQDMKFQIGADVVRMSDKRTGVVRNAWVSGDGAELVFVEATDRAGEFLTASLAGESACAYEAGLLAVPAGYDSVEHDDGRVHAIDLDGWGDGPLWRAEVVCGAATGVSSDEGGHAALHRRTLTCWQCAGILG